MSGSCAIAKLCRVTGAVGHRHQVAASVIPITNALSGGIDHGRDAMLRIALERDASSAGAGNAGVAEGQSMAVCVSKRDELPGLPVNVEGDALLGCEKVRTAEET